MMMGKSLRKDGTAGGGIPHGGGAGEAFSVRGVISDAQNREQSAATHLCPNPYPTPSRPYLLFPTPCSLFPVPCSLVQQESVALGIVGKNLAVTTPMQGSLNLLLGLILGEVFLQEVTKKLQWHGVV